MSDDMPPEYYAEKRAQERERDRVERLEKVAKYMAKRLPDQGDGIIRFEPRELTPEELRYFARELWCIEHGKLMEHSSACPWDPERHAEHDVHPCWPRDEEGKPLVMTEGPTFEETLRLQFRVLRIPGYDGFIMNTCGFLGCMRLDHYRDP
jgi:hypothetical protein